MSRPARRHRRAPAGTDGRGDRGGILVFVLVTVAIVSMIAVPMLSYTSAVFRTGEVQSDRAQAIELADGGTWVALHREADLFTDCVGGALTSSLPGVSTTCTVLAEETLRPASDVPWEVAAVQVGKSVPAAFTTPRTWTNPNTASNAAAWLAPAADPSWTSLPKQGKVWLPNLPVQAVSDGAARDTTMQPGTFDPAYPSCRVFFPGTFTSPITISGPAYFTSGVYYFTEPITLRKGADVVVGNGSELGCTNDFEAVSFAQHVPDPLNMSGLGGTFVMGVRGRITVDDTAGTGDVSLTINQRYVSSEETSVKASSDIAIVSVNGQHAPYGTGEAEGQGLSVPGVLAVPASKVGTAGTPAATSAGYAASVLTPKPTPPDPPTGLVADDWRISNEGRIVVSWTKPNENGALITGYTARDSVSGKTCSPAAPTAPDTAVQPSCTIIGVPNGTRGRITVTATNAVGTSSPSAELVADEVMLSGSTKSPQVGAPTAPRTPTIGGAWSNGLEVRWAKPTSDGGAPITGYRVTATGVLATTPTVTCTAWWDELSCILPVGGTGRLLPGQGYDIDVVAVSREGTTERVSPAARAATNRIISAATGTAPTKTAAVAAPRVPSPILDLRTTTSTTRLDVSIGGYVAVPQGRIAVSAGNAARVSVHLTGGVVAGDIFVDPAPGRTPDDLIMRFDNPIAQKRIRLVSVASGPATARSDAVVQVNRSGSLAINSWIVQ